MSDASELIDTIDAMLVALNRRGIRYFVTGSVASGIHGEYRATNDIDIVAALDETDIAPLLAELSGAFIADADQARAAVSTRSSFNLIHRTSYFKIDVFACDSPFDDEAERRAELIELPGLTAPLRVATREDILLSKLRWYRLGGEESEVQRRDIRGLIALNRGELDLAYVRGWAVRLHLEVLLDAFLA